MPTYIITENTTAQNATGTQYTGVEDSYMWSSIPTSNYGSATSFNVNKFGSGDHEHGLLIFSGLSSIPASETVTSATIYIRQDSSSATYSLDMRSLLVSWTEGGVNWNTRDGTTSWSTAGGIGSGTDRTSTPEATTSIAGTLQYYSFSCTSLVSDWHDGTLTNNGVHFERADSGEDGNTKSFVTSEGTDGQRPELVVVTSVASGSQEPSLIDGKLTNSLLFRHLIR